MVVSPNPRFQIDSHPSLSVSLATENNIFSGAASMLQRGIVQKSRTVVGWTIKKKKNTHKEKVSEAHRKFSVADERIHAYP